MTLELRQWEERDAPALNRAVAESLEHLRPWLPWASEPPMTDAARRAWIRERRREAAGGGARTFGIWVDGAIAGSVGLHPRVGPGALEIGYWTHVAFVRRGVASDGVARACAIAFAAPSIRHLEIHHDRANAASGAVARAAGFARVAERPRPPQAPGDTGVLWIWRLDRDAWLAARPG